MESPAVERLRELVTDRVESRIESAAPEAVKYVEPVRKERATGLVAAVYEQIAADSRLTSPLVLHSPVPPVLAGTWCILRETYLAGRVQRAQKEAVATAVSKANACPYCVTVHELMLQASGEASESRAIAHWADRTLAPSDPVLRSPPFAPSDAPEIIGTAIVFHYLNRMVSVFLDGSPVPNSLRFMQGGMRWLLGATFARRSVARPAPAPGSSLALLPDAALPADLRWAAAKPSIAGAFARAAAAADTAGREALPEAVRELVSRELSGWQGEAPGLGASWLREATAGLDRQDRPLAELALLTALVPYRVDAAIVAAFRAVLPGDAPLVGAASWAAMSAARRISSWLPIDDWT
jgi:AhpD family alkylhydroperoxidase